MKMKDFKQGGTLFIKKENFMIRTEISSEIMERANRKEQIGEEALLNDVRWAMFDLNQKLEGEK